MPGRVGASWFGRLLAALFALTLLAPTTTVPAGAATTWSVQASKNRGGVGNLLSDVACPTSSRCVAVGAYRNFALGTTTPGGTLIETYSNGRWATTASPSQVPFSQLSGVSCPTASRCYAVGSSEETHQALAVTSTGGPWSTAPTPTVGDGSSLTAISCVSATHCVAVGWSQSGILFRTLVMTLAGGSWSVTSSPNRGASSDNSLDGVSCASAKECVAVGVRTAGSVQRTLGLRLSAGAWSVMTTANRNAYTNWLADVSCVDATHCTAVGHSLTSTGAHRTLVEIWSGSEWVVVPSRNRGTGDNSLFGVACVDATDCTSVGQGGDSLSLVESWTGGGWSAVVTPNRGTGGNALAEVDCVTASECVAVGSSPGPSIFVSHTLVLRSAGP